MSKYAVYYDDGAHSYQLEVFTSEEEARKTYLEEIAKFKANPAEYTEQNPNDWDDEFYPDFELAVVDDEDECYLDTIDSWNPNDNS